MAEIQFLAYVSYSDGRVVNVTDQAVWETGSATSGVASWVNPYGLATTIPLVPPTGGVEGTYVTGGFLHSFTSFGHGLADPSGTGQGNAGYISEFWEIHTPQGGDVKLCLRGVGDSYWPTSSLDTFGLDTVLWLYDQNGLCIYFNDDVNLQLGVAIPQGAPAFVGYWSWLSTSLAPATTYYVEVSSWTPAYAFDYHLQFSPDIGVTATLQETLPIPFVQAPPVIDSITPATASNVATTPVVIMGSGFQVGLSLELSNSNYIRYPTVNNVSPTQIDATVSNYGTADVYDVKVINPDSQQFVLSAAFEHAAPPVLYSYANPGQTGEWGHQYSWFGAGDTFLISGSFPRAPVSACFASSTTAPVAEDTVWFAIDGYGTDTRGNVWVTATIPPAYVPGNGLDSQTHTIHVMDNSGLTARSYGTLFGVTDEFFGYAYGPGATGSRSGRLLITASFAQAPVGWVNLTYLSNSVWPETLPVRVLPKYYDTTGSVANSHLLYFHTPNMVNNIAGGFYTRITDFTGTGFARGKGQDVGPGAGWQANNGTGSNWPDPTHTKLWWEPFITVVATSSYSNKFFKHPGFNEVWDVQPNFGGGIVYHIYCLAKDA